MSFKKWIANNITMLRVIIIISAYIFFFLGVYLIRKATSPVGYVYMFVFILVWNILYFLSTKIKKHITGCLATEDEDINDTFNYLGFQLSKEKYKNKKLNELHKYDLKSVKTIETNLKKEIKDFTNPDIKKLLELDAIQKYMQSLESID